MAFKLNTFRRAYTVTPTLNEEGVHVGGITGFLMSMGYAIKQFHPTRVVVVFDGKDGSAIRRKMYPDYKQQRRVEVRLNRSETTERQDNELIQLVRLIQYLEELPISVVVTDGVEADDIIAYLVNDVFNLQCIIMSSDKDFLQLINDRVILWSPTKKKIYNTVDVYREYGVYPINFALYRSIEGDKSDNIKGINGIGLKTLKKRFPIITENVEISLPDFIKNVSEMKQTATTKKLLAEVNKLVINYQIMQLKTSLINANKKLLIIDMIRNVPKSFNTHIFEKMIITDKILNAFKNYDLWVREVFSLINNFNLKERVNG